MLVYGTGGHALEILDELIHFDTSSLRFFNNRDKDIINFYNFPVLKSLEEIKQTFGASFEFVIGIGNPILRKQKQHELISNGGVPISIISSDAKIANFDIELGKGLNIMSNVQISSRVSIGDGCLINRNSNIHHDIKMGNFCEIAPSVVLLGAVEIGEQTFIGSGAIVLPGIKIGRNCIIGAGSVVTKDVFDYSIVKGSPAK